MEACLAARAFAAGLCRGADPERACRGHVIGPHHEHWLAGYHAGLRAAEHATPRNATSAISCSRPARRGMTARL
jgi:hypothetical protein